MIIIKRTIMVIVGIHLLIPMLAARSSTDVMNQNVTVNVNVNPRQIKTTTPLQDLWDHVAGSPWPSEIVKFLYAQRYFIAVGAALGVYVFMCRECAHINHYLECYDSWGAWHKEYSLEMLLAMPQQQIAKDLVIDIQRRYSNNANPTDFISPLISFCKTIDHEIELVNRFLSIYSFLMRTQLLSIFPLNIKRCAELGDIKKRLQYIKNVFLSWAADYKIEHNKKTINVGLRYDPLCR